MSVGIGDVIIEKLIVALEDECQTPIATDDTTYATTIKAGMLNSDPDTGMGNHITIHYNDPRNPGKWMDEVVMVSSNQDMRVLRGVPGMDYAEIGGGYHWWRRFTVAVECHYTHLGYTQGDARQYAHTVFQRVKYALRNGTIAGSDDFDEVVADIFPKVRWEEKSEAGDGTEWIWRLWMGLEVMTSVS